MRNAAVMALVTLVMGMLAGCGNEGVEDGDVPGVDVLDDGAISVDGVSNDVDWSDGVATDITGDDGDSDAASVEFNPVLASTLALMLQEHIAFSPDPGLTLSVRNADGTWWSGAAGVSEIAEETPMQPDSEFRVGSNTKPIVAVVALQLVQEGRISLDEPLTTYLPQYPEWSDITVRMLLNMRSGLEEFLAVPACLFEIIFAPGDTVHERAEGRTLVRNHLRARGHGGTGPHRGFRVQRRR